MPSRIVKSAYRSAVKAGFKGSLKQWVEAQINTPVQASNIPAVLHVRHCIKWRANKAAQRKPSRARKAVRNHNSVHDVADVRSTQHASGSNITLRGEVREQSRIRSGTHGGGQRS